MEQGNESFVQSPANHQKGGAALMGDLLSRVRRRMANAPADADMDVVLAVRADLGVTDLEGSLEAGGRAAS